MHIAVNTLVHLLALIGTPSNEQERAQVAALARDVQAAWTKCQVVVDQGYTGEDAAPQVHHSSLGSSGNR